MWHVSVRFSWLALLDLYLLGQKVPMAFHRPHACRHLVTALLVHSEEHSAMSHGQQLHPCLDISDQVIDMPDLLKVF